MVLPTALTNSQNSVESNVVAYSKNNSVINAGTIILKKYRIIRLLGEGGMGQVYLAQDLLLNRLVAIKTLSLTNSYNEEYISRFLREGQTIASLNHTNILSIYEMGIENNRPFLVMEYIEGDTLREILDFKQIDLVTVIDLAIQLAKGLLAMHKINIIHRDLKLENFILRKDGCLKILDFGLAKSTTETKNSTKFQTRLGIVLGTIRYMSPEQARGKELDIRSDMFSFGLVLYELLTNRLAFDQEDDIMALHSLVFCQPEPISDKIPASLRELIEKLIEKNPNSRPQSMKEVLDILLAVREELSLTIHTIDTNYPC